MANLAATGSYVPKGISNQAEFIVKATLPSGGITSSETFTVTLPSGVDKSAVPVSVCTYVDLTSTPIATNNVLTIRDHNLTTGATVLVASGSVAAASIIFLRYVLG